MKGQSDCSRYDFSPLETRIKELEFLSWKTLVCVDCEIGNFLDYDFYTVSIILES